MGMSNKQVSLTNQTNKEMKCNYCEGHGYTAEHASQHGEDGDCIMCPVQAPCGYCFGRGVEPVDIVMVGNVAIPVWVIREEPPIYPKLVEQFGVSFEDGTCITYGDGIHLHHSQKLSDHLLEHEKIHVIQQHQYGVKAWWERYLSDPDFRKQQEGEAYRKQWQFIKSTRRDRNAAFRLKIQILKHLSSPMYGNCCSMQDAEKIIGK
jgi:hypothetical protein